MKSKKYIVPIGGAVLAFLVILLVTLPMLTMKTKYISIGIISMDKGMTTPTGEVNAGEQILLKLTEADNSVVKWLKVNNEQELKDNLKDGKYYATFLIPENFTQDSATGEAKIQVTINQGLHPMVSMTLTQMITALGTQAGLNLDITTINAIPSEFGMLGMMLPMFLVLITLIVSLVTSLFITMNIKIDADRKLISYLIQIAYMLVMAFIIGFTVALTVGGITGVELETAKIALYLTTVSISIMLLTNGAVNLIGKKGIVIPGILLILGIGTITVPFEYMPSAYQFLVASWEPLRYIGIGIRQVLYQGIGVLNSATISLSILSILGVMLSVVATVKKSNE